MTPEEAIWSRVTTISAVAAIAGARIYVEQLPQSPTYPCVLVRFIDDPTLYHLRGPDGTQTARIQIDSMAKRVSGVDARLRAADLWAAVNGDGLGSEASGVSGFKGTIGSPAFRVLACFAAGRTSDWDPEDLSVYTMKQDYKVTYRA